MNQTQRYIQAQFSTIWQDLDHIPTIKLFGKAGSTNHINITPDQLRAIEAVLMITQEGQP